MQTTNNEPASVRPKQMISRLQALANIGATLAPGDVLLLKVSSNPEAYLGSKRSR